MKNKDLRILFNAPLRECDTEQQTFGCRQNNPDICKYNGVEGVCAFVCEDCVCKKPSRAWKRQYELLKQKQQ